MVRCNAVVTELQLEETRGAVVSPPLLKLNLAWAPPVGSPGPPAGRPTAFLTYTFRAARTGPLNQDTIGLTVTPAGPQAQR